MYKKVRVLYELFYRKFYNQEKYIYSPSESAEKQINNFINVLDKKYTIESVGNNFLVTYFIFQFAYWSELELKEYNKTINLSYIIGKKAFQRWLDRDVNFDYTIDLFKVDKAKVTRNEALSLITEFSVDRNDNLKHEEQEKKRFFKTDRQLTHCIENTTLYNPRSVTCLACGEKSTCKEILEDRFPQIYYHRFKKEYR